MPNVERGSRWARLGQWSRAARRSWPGAAVATLVAVLVGVGAAPGHAGAPSDAPAAADLGTVRADGVTLTDAHGSAEQANAYTFRVADGPGTVQVYVGDLWYDVDVVLWQGAPPAGGAGQLRAMGCNRAAGCLASAPASARRRVQFVQPKGLFESVEPGTYTVVVWPKSDADFSAARGYTVRVAVSPTVCDVGGDAEGRYQMAMAMTPTRASRADLVTMTAYILPPFGDLFSFEWTADGRRLAADGPTAQAAAFELAGAGRSVEVQVVARGVRPYPDPDQPEIPPTLSLRCTLTIG